MMHGSREVRPRHSSCEADEQSGRDRRGAGGAKGGGQGECEPAKHVPDSEPGIACHRRWSVYGNFVAVTHPRWEPYAGKPHVRICAGGVSCNARPLYVADCLANRQIC